MTPPQAAGAAARRHGAPARRAGARASCAAPWRHRPGPPARRVREHQVIPTVCRELLQCCDAAWGPHCLINGIATTCAAEAGGAEAADLERPRARSGSVSASERPGALGASPGARGSARKKLASTPLFDADEEFVGDGDFGPAHWEPAAHAAPLIKPDPSPLIKPDPSPSPRAAAPRKRARRGASQPLFLPDEEFLGDWEPTVAPPAAEPATASGASAPSQAWERGRHEGGGSLTAGEAGGSQLWGSQPAAQPAAPPQSPRLRPSLLELALAGEPMAHDTDARPTPAPWDPPATASWDPPATAPWVPPAAAPAAQDAPAPEDPAGAAAVSGVVPSLAVHDAFAPGGSPGAAAGSEPVLTMTGHASAGVPAAPAGGGVAPGMAKLQAAVAARLQARRNALAKGSQA